MIVDRKGGYVRVSLLEKVHPSGKEEGTPPISPAWGRKTVTAKGGVKTRGERARWLNPQQIFPIAGEKKKKRKER